jgi:phosphohistidine swiveling domain-containing protein
LQHIYQLSDDKLSTDILNHLGGKAKNLHKLLLAGFPVPNGFVLTHYSESSNHDLMSQIDLLGGYPVAVRSSCSMEDLNNASFAGLYESYLDINNFEELVIAIKQCFESQKSERVKQYLATKNIPTNIENLQMSVIVQKMVNAKYSGVLFTLNPLNGKHEEMLGECCQGLGEKLVSGHVTPTRFSFNWQNNELLSLELNDNMQELPLTYIQKLIHHAIKIQSFYGSPQDIEWCIDQNHNVQIVQSRPITSFKWRTDFPEVTNADFKDGGISARSCTPLMYSAYELPFQKSMSDYFSKIKLIPKEKNVQWIFFAYGRAYWNAQEVKCALMRLPDFNEEQFDKDLGIQKDYGKDGPIKTNLTLSGLLNAIPVLFALKQEYQDCENMIDLYTREFEIENKRIQLSNIDLAKLDNEHFFKWLDTVINFQYKTEYNYFRTIYNNSNLHSELKGFLKKKLKLKGETIINLLSDLNSVSHLSIHEDLKQLTKTAASFSLNSSEYLSERANFLKIHYHHGPAELDITVERWGENPKLIDALVQSQLMHTSHDQLISEHKKSKFNQEFENIIFKLNENPVLNYFTINKFKKILNHSRKYLSLREQMRSLSTRAYYSLRIGLLELANRLKISPIEIFMLRTNELQELTLHKSLQLPDELKNTIQQRLHLYLSYQNFKAPNEFGGTIIQAKTKFINDKILEGIGCSSGIFIGKARIVLDINLANELTKEDILITKFTDPGWTPVFSHIGGVITEVGGILSHAAVIGREYQIPAILNLQDATQLINDGDTIKIDGSLGTVEILS